MEASTGAGSAESWLRWGLHREPCSAGVPPRTLGPLTRGWHWEPAALELRTLRPAGRNEISRPLSSGIKLGHFLRPSHRGGSHRGSVSTGAPTGSGHCKELAPPGAPPEIGFRRGLPQLLDAWLVSDVDWPRPSPAWPLGSCFQRPRRHRRAGRATRCYASAAAVLWRTAGRPMVMDGITPTSCSTGQLHWPPTQSCPGALSPSDFEN